MNIAEFIASPVIRLHIHGREGWLKHCLNLAPEGYILEFGVWQGHSINALAALTDQWVYGFDSFEGLPEDWRLNQETEYEIGHFGRDGVFPDVAANVVLTKGWFDESLPEWLDDNPGRVGFVHIDSDLYGSAKTVLSLLDSRLYPGSVIVFDELSDFQADQRYTAWEQGEWRALKEWGSEYGRAVEPVCRTEQYQACVVVQ